MPGSIGSDVRASLRSLRRSRAATGVAVLSLTIGIGATTTAFAVVHALLLRPLPYTMPERLVMLYPEFHGGESYRPASWSYPYFEALRGAAHPFEEVAAAAPGSFQIRHDVGERVTGEYVSAPYLATLGVQPILGRTFRADEDVRGAPVVIIGHALWQRLGRPDIASTLRVEGEELDIVGVLPPDFRGVLGPADLLVPMGLVRRFDAPTRLERSFNYWHQVVARVSPGTAAPAALEARLASLSSGLTEGVALPEWIADARLSITARPLESLRAGPQTRAAVLLVFGGALCVLLIACVNTASILLARSVDRRRELATRAAIGAGKVSLLLPGALEALCIAVAGGMAGLLVAHVALARLAMTVPQLAGTAGSTWRRLGALHLYIGMEELVAALVLAGVAGMLVAIAPAAAVLRDLRTGIGGAGRMTMATLRRGSAGAALVVVQSALAVLLLVMGGLLLRGVGALLGGETRFDAERLLTLETQLPRNVYADERVPFLVETLLARIAQVPGVEAATLDFAGPFSGWSTSRGVRVEGQPATGPAPGAPQIRTHLVGAGHFAALGVPILQGRDITAADMSAGRRVVVLGRTAADALFPGGDALGRRVWIGMWAEGEWAEIIGIAADPRYASREETSALHAYTPHVQVAAERRIMLLVRTGGEPARLAAAVRSAAAGISPDLHFHRVLAMEDRIALSAGGERLIAGLLATLAAVALLLAAIGVYGVISFGVSRGSAELGLRSALGAAPARLMAMVLGGTASWTMAGSLLGLAAALPLTSLLRSQLFGVGHHDPPTFALAMVIVVLTALLAAAMPARRAARADPLGAMRAE
jgi:putative ABC transport system permease protein